MKQKYFVLLFLYFAGLSAVFAQTYNYRNNGVLKIESGTTLWIGIEKGSHIFDNYGDVVNEGRTIIYRDRIRNYGDILNETIGTIIIGVFQNYSTNTNNGDFNVGSIFYNGSNGVHSNNGDVLVLSSYGNDGTVIALSNGTTTFGRRGVSDNNTQRIYGTKKLIEFNNLVINNNTKKGVLVSNGFGVFVKNNLHLQEGILRLEGSSQLIQDKEGEDSNTIGTGVILKDRTGIASGFGYNYYSSPVNNSSNGMYSLNTVLFDGSDSGMNPFSPTKINFTTAKDGIPSVLDGSGNVTTAATVSSNYMYAFLNGGIGEYADWKKIDETVELFPTYGYIMKGTNTITATQNYTFRGQPNNGDYSYSIEADESSLLGNPYPSALHIPTFLIENIVAQNSAGVGELYFWTDGGTTEHFSRVLKGGYGTRNSFGATPPAIVPDGDLGDAGSVPAPGPYAPVGQGFFVQATSEGIINFRNSHRRYFLEDNSSDGSIFYKNSKQKKEVSRKDDLSKNQLIRLGYEDPEGFHRQILLGFLPDAQADLKYNLGYDSPVFGPREDDLFFIIENDARRFVIQGVGNYKEDDVFPLSLTIAEEGVHTIMLDAVQNFEEDVFIYDTVLNVTYNLSEGSFSPDLGIGVYNERFQLVFKSQKTLSVTDPNELKFNVFYNNDNSIIINNKKRLEISKISIFNTLGQQLLSLKGSKITQSETSIPFSYNKGVYLVIIETSQGKETFRIIN